MIGASGGICTMNAEDLGRGAAGPPVLRVSRDPATGEIGAPGAVHP